MHLVPRTSVEPRVHKRSSPRQRTGLNTSAERRKARRGCKGPLAKQCSCAQTPHFPFPLQSDPDKHFWSDCHLAGGIHQRHTRTASPGPPEDLVSMSKDTGVSYTTPSRPYLPWELHLNSLSHQHGPHGVISNNSCESICKAQYHWQGDKGEFASRLTHLFSQD